MQSRPVRIGFQGLYDQQRKTCIGFERYGEEEEEDDYESPGRHLRIGNFN